MCCRPSTDGNLYFGFSLTGTPVDAAEACVVVGAMPQRPEAALAAAAVVVAAVALVHLFFLA